MGLSLLGAKKIKRLSAAIGLSVVRGYTHNSDHFIYLLWTDEVNCIEYNSKTGAKENYVTDGVCLKGVMKGKPMKLADNGIAVSL